MIQVSLSFGKFLGALFFGVLSDKYGRKMSFFVGCLIYMVSGPMVAFAFNYSMVVAGRIGLGAANSGIYNSAFVIRKLAENFFSKFKRNYYYLFIYWFFYALWTFSVSEIASKKRRAVLGILYNMSYPLGQMIVPLIAYLCRDWRMLQIIISVPAVLIFAFYWWELIKKRKKKKQFT